MTRLPVAVVGVGHLGKEHARILASFPDVELIGVADPRPAQAELVAQRCGTRAYTDHRPLLPLVRAAVIAAPTAHHHAVAGDFLRAGIPLLIEKPMTATLDEAEELVDLADAGGVLLQVGHIERFNPAFEELQRRPIQPRYIVCSRWSGFSGRSTDVGAVLDVMIHDVDLVLALVQAPVCRVEALGVAVLGGHEDLAQARLTFANGCVADLSASRVHPSSVRTMQVWGAEGYAGVDFSRRHLTLMQPAEHLRRGRMDTAALKADLFGRHVQALELECDSGPADQLTRELKEFVGCVRGGRSPRIDGQAGLAALEVASRILASINTHPWTAHAGGPLGPHHLPAPCGSLFALPAQEAA